MADVPNVLIGKEPHNEFLTSVNYPNMWSLNRKQPGGKQKKKKEGDSNLMDTGPDDANPFVQAAEADKLASIGSDSIANAIGQGWQGSPQSGQAGVADYGAGAINPFTGNPVVGGQEQGAYGFRDKALEGPAMQTIPNVPGEVPVPPQEKQAALMDTGPDDSNFGGGPIPPQGGWTKVFPEGGSGYQVNTADKWAPGNYNIAGENWHGNRTGYEGSSRVQMGYGLSQVPALGITGAIANTIGEKMIGHDELDDGTRITAGSFDQGAFSDKGGQDVSGGATGGDLGVDAKGNKVSLGYGYGQVDPRLAGAAGFSPQTGPGTTPTAVTGGLGAAPAPGSPEARATVSKDNSGYTGTPEQNKQEADREAEQQAGPGAKAVTDSSGKPVRSSDNSIVTSGGNNDNDSGGGGGGGGK